jgi:hypothetical protein
MPAPPKSDRTSAVVAAGLALLALLGVLTVFSGPLMALIAPPPADQAAAEPDHGPSGPAGAADAGVSGHVVDIGRTDGGGHS